MNETLLEFAELVGRCLAKRWLRERDLVKDQTVLTCTPAQRDEAGNDEHAARSCRSETPVLTPEMDDS